MKTAIDCWYVIGIRYYILGLLLPLIGLASIRNLRILAPFSIIANLVLLTGKKSVDHIAVFTV